MANRASVGLTGDFSSNSPSISILACLMAFSFIVTSHDTVCAIQPDDSKVARELVGLIRKKDADSFARGKDLFRSIADTPVKPVACQALALLAIQSGRYSDAWQVLSSAPTLPENISLQTGHDRLQLWLLLEAPSSQRAETQFKKLVTLVVTESSANKVKAETVSFLGGVVALLESRAESSGMSASILSKARSALESLKSDAAAQRFKSSYESAIAWAKNLESCRDEVEKLEPDRRLERAASNAQRLDEARGELVKQSAEVLRLRQERRKLEQHEEEFKRKWNPNLGMPQMPSRPKKDREESDNEFDRRVASYERRVLEYPQKMAEWEVVKKKRQDFFDGQLRDSHEKLARTDAQLATVAESEKKLGELVQTLRDEALLLKSVCEVLESNSEKKSLLRPSCFHLLDFDQEAARLESCLRQLK